MYGKFSYLLSAWSWLREGRDRVMAAIQARDPRARVRKTARKSERLETRVTPEQKELVQQAAALQGRSLTDFVSASVQQAAEQTIREHTVITLSARDSRAVMEALLNPEPAGPWLRQAVERYKAIMGDR